MSTISNPNVETSARLDSVENTLNRLDGVSATVSYTTDKAKVYYPSIFTVEDFIGSVEAT